MHGLDVDFRVQVDHEKLSSVLCNPKSVPPYIRMSNGNGVGVRLRFMHEGYSNKPNPTCCSCAVHLGLFQFVCHRCYCSPQSYPSYSESMSVLESLHQLYGTTASTITLS